MSTSWNAQQPEQHNRGVSVPHLVMGLVFLGLAGSWLLHQAGVIGSVDVEWLLPLILVVAGAAGLLASLTRGVGRGSSKPSNSPTDSPANSPSEETFVTDDETP